MGENTIIDGRYRLAGRLGSGGMADVYAADDTHLGRRVALKILHSRFAQDQEFVERFRREASHAAGLAHPNVVNVYDRGEIDGTYYIAMEFLEGRTLKQMIGAGLSVEQAVDVTRQVLVAARFAHNHGVIHRDLKPHNVIVDSEGRAKVTDFGIARAGSSEMTQAGSIMGTAQYLSPEQAQGLPVTAASDLYSIGVLLYEALTGRVPFDGDSAVAVALKQVSEEPVPPRGINPTVSPALDAVVMRALAKDPVDRFADADEFLADLEHAVNHPTDADGQDTAAFAAVAAPAGRTQVRPPAPPTPSAQQPAPAEPPRRRPWRWIIVGLAILLAAAMTTYALTRPGKELVPRVIGQPAPSATQLLEQRGFDVDIRQVRSAVERDTVLEQDPLPGTRVDEGSSVILTVSTGPGTVEVPSIEGLTARSARRRLEDADLQVTIKREFSEDMEKGLAVRTEPAAGTEIKRGSEVSLFLSKGLETVDVPDLIGKQQDVAEAAVREAKLRPDVSERDSDMPEGEVVDQAPDPGSQAKRDSTVTIFVSNGKGSTEVPSVVGRSQQRATDLLHQKGLRVLLDPVPVDKVSQDGLVIEQSPSPGERSHKGDQVTITVGRFQPPSDLGDGQPGQP